MSNLIIAEQFYNDGEIMGVDANGTAIPVSYWAHWRYGPLRAEAVDPAGDTDDPTVEVFINHGRWMTSCPDPTCGGAQVASETDHRFYCATCENALWAHLTLPVVWPDDQEAIEAILTPRPEINRNWRPGETIEQLVAENVTNGVIS